MKKGFIKDENLLKENPRVDDLLDFTHSINSFTKILESIDRPVIIGLVGPFGVGKSTMLYQLEKEYDNDTKWINFDAWKYPDRKDLWEGFLLDFADQVGKSKKIKRNIDGKSAKSKYVDIATDVIAKITEKLPDLGFLDKFSEIFNASPAKRVYELQEIFTGLIKSQTKDFVLVVEDIDRSGDAGIFFLETLSQFISTLQFSHKFIVIVPMSNTNYERNIDSYLKSVDYFEFFEPTNIKLDKFVDTLFNPKLFEGSYNREIDNKLIWTGANRRTQVIGFLEGLFVKEKEMSMRLLKLILRKANLAYKNQTNDGHKPDFRVTLCIEASKYFKYDKEIPKSYYDGFKNKGRITANNIFSAFLITMLRDSESMYVVSHTRAGEKKELISSPKDFKLVDRENNDCTRWPSHPWQYSDYPDETGYGITSFYVKY